MTDAAPLSSARASAQSLVDSAKKSNSTLDNVERLIVLFEEAAPDASARDIADLLSSHMGACVPWDRGTTLGFQNLSNLLAWRNGYSKDVEVTVSHAFAAVSMKGAPRVANALINHSADFVDGIVKGAGRALEGRRFSMEYGYGKPNRLGDYLGNHLAAELAVTHPERLGAAFRAARRKMQL